MKINSKTIMCEPVKIDEKQDGKYYRWECKNCGRKGICLGKHFPNKIYAQCNNICDESVQYSQKRIQEMIDADNTEMPNILQMGMSYAKELAKWNAAGRPIRKPEVIQEIFDEKCRVCPFFQQVKSNNEEGQCKICGCFLKRNSIKRNKIAMGTTRCPKSEPEWVEEECPEKLVGVSEPKKQVIKTKTEVNKERKAQSLKSKKKRPIDIAKEDKPKSRTCCGGRKKKKKS